MQIQVIKYKLNIWGRIKVLFTGKIFLIAKSDGQQIQFDLETKAPTPPVFSIPMPQNPVPQMAEDPAYPMPEDPEAVPSCQHDKVQAGCVLTSNPPQIPWVCRKCGEQGTDVAPAAPVSEYEQILKSMQE